MKNKLFLLFVLLLFATRVSAQVFVLADSYQSSTVTAGVTVVDSLTNEPMQFASVYLVPVKDTIITHFALTDKDGKAELKKAVKMGYVAHVEMTGYKPWSKTLYFRNTEENIGVVRMQEDRTMLDAASVTAAAVPVVVLQDTIIYNAAAFRSGEFDMLGDLLKKMPGIEVGEDGSVKVNGEIVKKITVGGKTFFFDDPSAAVNNLPARIVDKVKVLDKDTDKSEATGIEEKEKVMDIELKEEFKKGFFGNATVTGGGSIPGNNDSESPLVQDYPFLYNTNVLAAAYNEDTQLTALVNSHNLNDGYMAVSGPDDMNGLSNHSQAGVNLNTDKIKGVEVGASVNYKNTYTDSRTYSEKTTFRSGQPDLLTTNANNGWSNKDAVSARLELKNTNRKKFAFNLKPAVSYTRTRKATDRFAVNADTDTLNTSDAHTSAESDQMRASVDAGATVKNLGKPKRNLNFDLGCSSSRGNADSREFSLTEYRNDKPDMVKDLCYDSRSRADSYNVGVGYTEPFGKFWSVHASVFHDRDRSLRVKDAFNADGSVNDYYSSSSDNLYMRYGAGTRAQFKKDKTLVQAGFNAQSILNETVSRSYGIETESGMGDWMLKFSPSFRFKYNNKKGFAAEIEYYLNTNQPSGSYIQPALDISSPTSISVGNSFLRPSFDHRIMATLKKSNMQNHSFFLMYLTGGLEDGGIVYSSWFDGNGIHYSVPVNSLTDNLSGSAHVTGGFKLDKDAHWNFQFSFAGSGSRNGSFQNVAPREGIDVDEFRYDSFISEFWGGDGGNRFYSGESGFAESITKNNIINANIGLFYKNDWLETMIFQTANHSESSCSLSDKANTDTWNWSSLFSATVSTRHAWEISGNCIYEWFRGYSAGFGDPRTMLGFSVRKSVKALSFELKVHDLLNQSQYKGHRATENYVVDSYHITLGRYVAASVKFNFGKMNASNSKTAQKAARELSW